jgi:hypothetical protein
MTDQPLNPLGIRIRDSVLQAHEDWAEYTRVRPSGDLEIAVPAPRGSRAKHLVIFTARGEETWIRYSPARACYRVETDREMHAVVEALLADRAFLVVVTDGDAWVETAILRPGEEAVLGEGQVANVLSWSGHHDKIVTYTEKRPTRGA